MASCALRFDVASSQCAISFSNFEVLPYQGSFCGQATKIMFNGYLRVVIPASKSTRSESVHVAMVIEFRILRVEWEDGVRFEGWVYIRTGGINEIGLFIHLVEYSWSPFVPSTLRISSYTFHFSAILLPELVNSYDGHGSFLTAHFQRSPSKRFGFAINNIHFCLLQQITFARYTYFFNHHWFGLSVKRNRCQISVCLSWFSEPPPRDFFTNKISTTSFLLTKLPLYP